MRKRLDSSGTPKAATTNVAAERPPKGQTTTAVANLDAKSKLLQTPGGETSITKKEEALEAIMCAEALAGFERMARYQLDRRTATRTTMDPDKLDVDLEKLTELYLDRSDIEDPDSESDSEMIDKFDLQYFSAGPDDNSGLESKARSIGIWNRLGFGFCQSNLPQDRIFIARCANYTLMGLVNGHGSRGVSEKLVRFISEEFSRSFFKSAWLTQENDGVTALSHAFDRTHRRALKELDCRLTGACTTALLLDEERVYVAHVGNCRAVLAVPDPNINAQKYHYIPVPLTEDHRLAAKSEFERVSECGGEIRRLVNDNVHRLFFKEDSIPGLTLTRGIGHRMGHRIGIIHIPSISVLERKDFHKDSFIILGSGGIWHAMSERGVVNWIGTHFASPFEAAKSIAEEAKLRWSDRKTRLQAYVHRGAPESFGALIVHPSLEETGVASESLAVDERRQFTLGPHREANIKIWPDLRDKSEKATMPRTLKKPRDWKEVRQTNWKEDLATIMSGGCLERDLYGQD
jgi:serine/threonine protein phosphatase PrpC